MKRLRDNFITGILVILPALITLWLLYWMVAHLLRFSLFILPSSLEVYFQKSRWAYVLWSVFVFLVIVIGIAVIGVFTRNFVGKKVVKLMEWLVGKIPLVNKVYTLVQKISLTLLGRRKGAFLEAVLVEYPRKGIYSIGFVTSHWEKEVFPGKDGKAVAVFIPTAPNPTSGFLIVVKEKELIPLGVSVQDAFGFVISGGMASLPLKREKK
ncbi:MAG: DUF502 domain-containing protein [Caldiserica bacterium]|nr:DUF502 domain-containing protein [Caldisericota bacterium]